MSTHTAVGPRRWAHVLVAGLAKPFELKPSHVPNDVAVTDGAEPLLAWTGYSAARGAANVTLGGLWAEGTPIRLPACGYSDFGLWHAAPVVSLGAGAQLALLGEPTKWAPVSVARVASAAPSADSSDFVVTVRGDAGESVELAFATRSGGGAWTVRSVTCVLPASAEATAHLLAQSCA